MTNHEHNTIILVALAIIVTVFSTLLYERYLTTLFIGDGVVWAISFFPLLMLFLAAGAIDECISASQERQKVADEYIKVLDKGYNEYREILYTMHPELKPHD